MPQWTIEILNIQNIQSVLVLSQASDEEATQKLNNVVLCKQHEGYCYNFLMCKSCCFVFLNDKWFYPPPTLILYHHTPKTIWALTTYSFTNLICPHLLKEQFTQKIQSVSLITPMIESWETFLHPAKINSKKKQTYSSKLPKAQWSQTDVKRCYLHPFTSWIRHCSSSAGKLAWTPTVRISA